MSTCRRARRAICILLLLAAAGTAQERREPVRGSTVLDDGEPWPGATVHLLSRPLPLDERLGAADEQTAVADAKGRFLVQLLPGRHYTAWAVEELADGRYRASFAAERVIGGRPLELIADAPRQRQKITFAGLEPWRARGKVVARLMSCTDQRIVIEATLTGDEWLLPLVPGRKAVVEITCDGLPFFPWPRRVDLTQPEKAWRLPGPRAVRFKVVDAAGAPVAGAALTLDTIDPPEGMRVVECPLGRTDAKGEAVVTMPLDPRDFGFVNYAFGVAAPGFAPVRNIARMNIPANHDGTKDGPAMTLALKAGAAHELRLSRGEQPFVSAVACSTAGATVGENSFTPYGDAQRRVAPDARGRFPLLRMTDAIAVLVGATDSLRKPEGLAVPLHPMALLGVIAADEARAEIAWDLDTLLPLVLQVVSPDGTPVEAARLAVLVDERDYLRRALSGLGTDRSGQIAALVPAGFPVTVVAWTEDGFAVTKVTAVRDAPPTVLALEKVASLPGKVVGKDGKPVAFAVVQCYVSANTGKSAAVALGVAVKLLEVPTDREGAFRLPLFPGLEYSVRGVVTPDDENYLTRSWTVGKDEPDELLLALGTVR